MNTFVEPGRIVVGVDGSRPSLAALRWAAGEARLRHGQVVAVLVWQPTVERLAPYAAQAGRPSARQDQDLARARLHGAIHHVLGDIPDVPVHPVLEQGWTAPVLLRHAATADLLVMGGRPAPAHTEPTLGAVTAACLRRSPCPVVIVAHPEPVSEPVPAPPRHHTVQDAPHPARLRLVGRSHPVG